MIPSLYTFSLIATVVLLVLGAPFLLVPARIEKAVRAFPRHRLTGVLTMILGGGWFLFKISQLSQSDFGDYKKLLLLLFLATLIGSIYYVRDFLAVRGVAILILLSANTGLKFCTCLSLPRSFMELLRTTCGIRSMRFTGNRFIRDCWE
jgi:hypothetical protein